MSDWSDIGKRLAKLGLPLLGAALPVPGGAAIGAALAAMIGPDAEGNTPQTAQDLVDRITVDPQARQRALEFQTQHRERMTAMALDHEHRMTQSADKDRADARARDISMLQAGRANVRANWMIVLDVVGLLAGLGAMMALGWYKARYPDAISEGVFGALLAQLATITSFFGLGLRDAHQFEFGSSRGSRDKDARGVPGAPADNTGTA